MERRVLIAVLLSFLVLYGYQALFPPPPEPKPAQATSKVATAPKASGQEASNPATSVQGSPQQAAAATPFRSDPGGCACCAAPCRFSAEAV